jgi:hypothetical protein
MVHSAQIVHLSSVKISTITKQTETSIHLSLFPLEFHMFYAKQFLSLGYVWHKPCTDTNTVSKWTKTRFTMNHVIYEFHRVRPKPFLGQWYVQCKPCTYLASRLALSPNGLKSHWDTIGYVQNDYWAHGTFGATMHLSCTYTNTVSKRTEIRFDMTHIT